MGKKYGLRYSRLKFRSCTDYDILFRNDKGKYSGNVFV